MEKIRNEHLTETEIEELVRARLPRGAAPAVFSHLINCDHCAALYEQEQNLRDEFRLAVAEETPPVRAERKRSWSRTPALAALAFGALLLMLPFTQPSSQKVRTVELKAYRGSSVSARSGSGPLRLKLDATGLPEAGQPELRIVTADGHPVWTSTPRREQDEWVDTVPRRLPKGLYWVRLTEPGMQNPIREYRLEIV